MYPFGELARFWDREGVPARRKDTNFSIATFNAEATSRSSGIGIERDRSAAGVALARSSIRCGGAAVLEAKGNAETLKRMAVIFRLLIIRKPSADLFGAT